MIVEGEKYACEACVRGHRVSTCQHSGQSLIHLPHPFFFGRLRRAGPIQAAPLRRQVPAAFRFLPPVHLHTATYLLMRHLLFQTAPFSASTRKAGPSHNASTAAPCAGRARRISSATAARSRPSASTSAAPRVTQVSGLVMTTLGDGNAPPVSNKQTPRRELLLQPWRALHLRAQEGGASSGPSP